MAKKLICLFLCALMVLGVLNIPITNGASALAAGEKKNYNGLKVGYIPVDDRPVNYERVQWLAKSVGIDLLMPERDLFRTALDNMTPNKNGTTYGDREALVEWLKEVDDECDYFVISLDQMLSGGLVSSRWLSNTDLTLEYKIADYIIDFAENNTVVLFDTVMRLASTVNYEGYQMTEYNELRSYGAKERKVLTGEQLTVENIIDGYQYAPNGSKIYSSLSDSAINKYLASRTRKLKLNDYILSHSLENLDFCYIGVDDSKPQNTIQTNEINYIQNKLGDNGVIYAAIDELGLMGLTRIVAKVYGTVDINVTYFGNGVNSKADDYDYLTTKQVIDLHIQSLGCTVAKNGDGELDFLVLTRNASSSDITKMVDRIIECIENELPVIVVDPNSGNGTQLQQQMISRGVSLTLLLGYSNWNTAANSTGIALSNGISRYTYLKNSRVITQESHYGFLQAATFGYLKDMGYKYGAASYETILQNINNSWIITSLDEFKATPHGTVTMSNIRQPWNRTFEIVFDVNVTPWEGEPEVSDTPDWVVPDYLLGDINNDGAIDSFDYILARAVVLGLYTPNEGEFARGDITENGKIDSFDYLLIRAHVLGIKQIVQ